ncbi:MAG: hypothetical protein IJR58_08635 [Lachnospiraceae bacterium]|nr:hypothetical protein [Lachnospiraceae bacterium]
MSECRMIQAPNLVAVLVDEYTKEGAFCGRLAHLYEDSTCTFNGAQELLTKMDALYDSWNYPQRATMQRYFGREPKKVLRKTTDMHLNEKERVRTVEELYALRGSIATFMIHTQMRQNASWQGQAMYLEEGLTQQFQSVLELLRMTDAALKQATKKGAKQ